MASSRGTSNGPDVKDTADTVRAFEEANRVVIVMTLRPIRGTEEADIWIDAKAMSERDGSGVRSILALASVKCLGSRHKTLDAAVLAALYALDFQLAQKEFENVEQKEA